MKRFTAPEIKQHIIACIKKQRKTMPPGDYSATKRFPAGLTFKGEFRFSQFTTFGDDAKFTGKAMFGQFCTFGNRCVFEWSANFGLNTRFGTHCVFAGDAVFASHCYIGANAKLSTNVILPQFCFFGRDAELTTPPYLGLLPLTLRCSKLEGPGSSPYIVVTGFGSENRTTTFFNTNQGIFVKAGCFFGSLEKFRAKVKKDCRQPTSIKRLQYLGMANIACVTWGYKNLVE